MRARARVTWIGHATALIEFGMTRVITDPVLRDRVGPLRRRADLPVVQAPQHVDAVLLSHLHHDHADLPSLRSLPRVPVVTARSNAHWVRRRGLLAPELEDERWWEVSDEMQVRLVPAVHEARPMPHRPNAAVGMLVRGGGIVIWFAGDTSLYPRMAELPEMAQAPIDLALLPIGGWGPRLSAGHMGPVEAAEAATLAGVRTVVPIHYGTLHPRGWPRGRLEWTAAPAERFAGVLAERSEATAEVLPVGGHLELA